MTITAIYFHCVHHESHDGRSAQLLDHQHAFFSLIRRRLPTVGDRSHLGCGKRTRRHSRSLAWVASECIKREWTSVPPDQSDFRHVPRSRSHRT